MFCYRFMSAQSSVIYEIIHCEYTEYDLETVQEF